MNLRIFKILLIFLFGGVLISGSAFAEGDGKGGKNRLNKPTGSPIRAYLNINNISTVIKNTGISDIDAFESASGLIYPFGSGKGAVYVSGLLWGAVLDGNAAQPLVGGSAYREGLQGGWIESDGTVVPNTDSRSRIYRVRPDVYPGGPSINVSKEAGDEGKSEAAVTAQYETDWANWPADLGAPYFDGNGNGQYDSDASTGDIPGFPGADQTVWFVCNDQQAGLTQDLYGSLPMGIEMQATMWAYASAGPLGNMYFRKYIIINKTDVLGDPKPFEDMYVSMWSDPDVGNSTDDFAGSDTLLSLSYAYNGAASDATYDPLPPPAAGFDFFQGPIVESPGDTAIFKGAYLPGFKNLPMTASYYFVRGDANVTDPTQGDPQGAVQFYRFMQGKVGLTGEFFVDPITGLETTFTLTGDPFTGEGWVDGLLIGPDDRRIGMASGPFTMEPGDTQEVVVAEIMAGATPGTNYLAAVNVLKQYDIFAQEAYDKFFQLPSPPLRPNVQVSELDREIVLNWGWSQDDVITTESNVSDTYEFEGYNVYQLPSASASVISGIRLATFDLVTDPGPVIEPIIDPATGELITEIGQYGNNTGIQRLFNITKNAFDNTPLINGIKYYFAVTAYSVTSDYDDSVSITVPKSLENPILIITVIPQSTRPGEVYGADIGDSLTAVHSEGLSDGNLFPLVVEPDRLTGLSYTVSFDTIPGGAVVWHADRSDGVRVLENITDQNNDVGSPTADGIQFRVQGAPNDFKLFEVVANGNGPIDPPVGGALDFGGFPSLRPDDTQQVGEGHWAVHTADNGGSSGGGDRGDFDAFKSRVTRAGGNWPAIIPDDFEMRFTGDNSNPGVGGGYAQEVFNDDNVFWVPFELWNIGSNTTDDPSDDYRLISLIIDDAGPGNEGDDMYLLESWGNPTTGGGDLEHSVSGADNDPFTDWVYWYRPVDTSPGTAGYDLAEAEMLAGTYTGEFDTEVMARTVLVNWNGDIGDPNATGVYNQDVPEMGTIFRITSTKPNVAFEDKFTFTAPANTMDVDLAREDVNKVNVFPNPYYGINTEEINKYNRFVTFTHMPERAKVRIFNLAGVLVRTIEKDDEGQYLRWELTNEDQLPVASGLYIAYIEFTDLGETKILKLAIVQEQQILDRF